MKCPYCGHEETKVTDSRVADDGSGIRRRRECLGCSRRFTTYEHVQAATLQVKKRDGRVEDYSREKLAKGIRIACAKRPLSVGAIDKMVDEIEAELQKTGRAEVTSSVIGGMVMERLKKLDRVAYIRFASVYRDFADIENFKQEIEELMQSREARQPPTTQLALIPEEPRLPVMRRRRRMRQGSAPVSSGRKTSATADLNSGEARG